MSFSASAMLVNPSVNKLAILLALSCCLVCVPSAIAADSYNAIDGYLCTNRNYVENHTEVNGHRMCSALCSMRARCQAFTTADGLCQLFAFDECSKSVKDCNCSRRGQVFVKLLAGLGPGQLCPAGYGDDLCGVKYKVYSGGNFTWSLGRQKCDSESGLVIMADVVDTAEMNQVDSLHTKYINGSHMWLGGFQQANSSEPAGGFYWVGCNITLAAVLWASGQPDNYAGLENAIGRKGTVQMLNDFIDSNTLTSVMCECASPF